MNKFGLIGFPLEHSFSKKYFDKKFLNNNIKNASYDNYEINDIQKFKDLIKNNPEIKGLNVTIPYKKKIIPFLNKIDSKAKLIGAVNVVKINDGFLIGYIIDRTAIIRFYYFQIPRAEIIPNKFVRIH